MKEITLAVPPTQFTLNLLLSDQESNIQENYHETH